MSCCYTRTNVGGLMARSNAAIDDPFSGRRRPDSGHRPCDPLQAVGRVGAAYPRLRARTHSDLPALVPTNRQPQRAQRLGATSRFLPPSPGPAPSRWARWGCLSAAWAWGLNKPRSFQGAGSRRAPLSLPRRPGGGGRNPCPSPAPSRWARWGCLSAVSGVGP